jgi:hypothetical protein
LDADDAWLPEKLRIQMEQIQHHPDVEMWCGEVRSETTEGRRQRSEGTAFGERASGDPICERTPIATVAWRRIDLQEFACGNPVATSTVLIKRAALEAVAGFDEQFRGPEDYDLWIRVTARFPVALIERPLAFYRQDSLSLSMDDRKFLPEVLRVLDKAFGEGGALSLHRALKQGALSNQFWNASWMAFRRGARLHAIQYWSKAYMFNLASKQPVERRWFRLLLRYILMPKGQRGEQ